MFREKFWVVETIGGGMDNLGRIVVTFFFVNFFSSATESSSRWLDDYRRWSDESYFETKIEKVPAVSSCVRGGNEYRCLPSCLRTFVLDYRECTPSIVSSNRFSRTATTTVDCGSIDCSTTELVLIDASRARLALSLCKSAFSEFSLPSKIKNVLSSEMKLIDCISRADERGVRLNDDSLAKVALETVDVPWSKGIILLKELVDTSLPKLDIAKLIIFLHIQPPSFVAKLRSYLSGNGMEEYARDSRYYAGVTLWAIMWYLNANGGASCGSLDAIYKACCSLSSVSTKFKKE